MIDHQSGMDEMVDSNVFAYLFTVSFSLLVDSIIC